MKTGIISEAQKHTRENRTFSNWRLPFISEKIPRLILVIKNSIGGIRKILKLLNRLCIEYILIYNCIVYIL